MPVWTAEKKLPRADYCMYVGETTIEVSKIKVQIEA